MRMRKMKNLVPRMEKCADFRIENPETYKGAWRSLKEDARALWVEVGCGKGKFTAETAEANPDVLLIAVERCREAMVVAMEKAQSMGLTNVLSLIWTWRKSRRFLRPLKLTGSLSTSPTPGPGRKMPSVD